MKAAADTEDRARDGQRASVPLPQTAAAADRPSVTAWRLFPAPIISALLFVSWLLLNLSLSLGHIALAALLAIVIPWFTERLRPDRPRLRHPTLGLQSSPSEADGLS